MGCVVPIGVVSIAGGLSVPVGRQDGCGVSVDGGVPVPVGCHDGCGVTVDCVLHTFVVRGE